MEEDLKINENKKSASKNTKDLSEYEYLLVRLREIRNNINNLENNFYLKK